MKIISVEESGHEIGGVNVTFDDGRGPIPFHLHDEMVSPRASQLRLAIKDVGVTPIKDVVARNEKSAKAKKKAAKDRKIRLVNEQLKGLDAKQINTLEEIPNAQAFILFERARIFREGEGS